VQQYIRFRWAKAGGREAPPFTADGIAGITQWSQGIPRLINSICDTALLMAYGDECPLVALNYIRAAAGNLSLLDVSAPLVTFSHTTTMYPVEKHHGSLKLGALEMTEPPAMLTNLLSDTPLAPASPTSADLKTNSSLMKRLAEKFGLPR
jgi:hypothetical protein